MWDRSPSGADMLMLLGIVMFFGWAVIEGLLWLLSFVHIEVVK